MMIDFGKAYKAAQVSLNHAKELHLIPYVMIDKGTVSEAAVREFFVYASIQKNIQNSWLDRFDQPEFVEMASRVGHEGALWLMSKFTLQHVGNLEYRVLNTKAILQQQA